ncbi:hypothetical protein [Niveibacterium sp. SC-1]|uniref:hypothetical protein n=1 Tax=Niveibacterium sp. SC-1 TaxID=3135646 RepID=UPI00311D62AE
MNEHPNTPDETDAEAAARVSAAYGRLPAAAPSAALDARIRAAVAAELGQAVDGNGRDSGKPTAELIHFPWWRRASAPLAVAASLVVALGLGQWWFLEGGAQQAPGASEQLPPAAPAAEMPKEIAAAPATAVLSAAPAPETTDRAKVAAPAADEAPAPRKPASAVSADVAAKKAALSPPADSLRESEADARRAMKAMSEPQVASTPPPVEQAASSGVPREDAAANQARAGAEEQPRVAAARTRKAEAEPTPSISAAPAPAAAPAPRAFAADEVPGQARTESPQREEPALRHVRELLAQGKTLEARTALERWRKANPELSVPEDLRALLMPGAAASTPD